MTKPTTARNTPLMATALARCWSLAPRAWPIRALTPTAVPVARPIIRFWAGNARDTAVSACSHTRDTNTLSTMLYRACTSIDAMMGRDMLMMSLEMGMVPNLFSFSMGLLSPPYESVHKRVLYHSAAQKKTLRKLHFPQLIGGFFIDFGNLFRASRQSAHCVTR